jgi:hypothetical protein
MAGLSTGVAALNTLLVAMLGNMAVLKTVVTLFDSRMRALFALVANLCATDDEEGKAKRK